MSWVKEKRDLLEKHLEGVDADTDFDKHEELFYHLDDLQSLVPMLEEALAAAAPEVAADQDPKPSAPRGGAERKLNAQKSAAQEQRAKGRAVTDEEIAQAREYVERVLGPKIKVEFEKTTEYSGEWLDAEQTIRLSTLTNAGLIDVARHEALHAFFSKFVQNNPKAVHTLNSLVNNEGVVRQLQRLLKDEPAALEQLKDGEERLAYIYQFWGAGMLKLPHTPGTTVMAKVRKFLRRVFMMVSDEERAVNILHAFEAGQMQDPDTASRVIVQNLKLGTWASANPGRLGALSTRLAGMALPAHSILMGNASKSAREIGRLMFTNPGDERDGDGQVGYLNARNQRIRQYANLFRNAVDDLTPQQVERLTDALHRELTDDQVRDPAVIEARDKLQGMFARFHRYLTDENGVRMGKISENYFPVVFDAEKVLEGDFAHLLGTKYRDRMEHIAQIINAGRRAQTRESGMDAPTEITVEEVIEGVIHRIARTNPLDDSELDPLREDGVLRPWFASGERRVLNFLDPEDRAEYQERDLVKTVTRYINQGVRAAEYSKRFGRNGAGLHLLLMRAKGELESASVDMLKSGDLKNDEQRQTWVKRQYANIANAAGAMEGSLGHEIPEWWRNASSAAVVYQNVRLLPLALFASFVDPLGIAVRGGEMKDAFGAFMRGMKSVARNWGDMLREQPKEYQKDQWEQMAELAGVIDSATFSHLLADEYGSIYHKGFARKTNELMFKANGLEPWNRAMRIAATESAAKFMIRHNKGEDKHSARWMKELGFEVGSLPLDSNGQLIIRKDVMRQENPGMSEQEAEATVGKVHAALVRWVEGAILSPSAAHRPAWGSDPHYGMFWHLKQFAYSFHNTMLTRAKNEAGHGNYMPLGALAWYVPTMIGADITKALMLGGGELPGYMKGYDLGDWMLHGVDRSGGLGMAQPVVDAIGDPASLAGPMADQVWDAIVDPVEKTVVRALPANAVYSRAIF